MGSKRLPVQLVDQWRVIQRVLIATDNAFFRPLWSNNEAQDRKDINRITVGRSVATNPVAELIKNKSVRFKSVDTKAAFKLLPGDLTMDALRDWNAGPYAIRLARAYLSEACDALRYSSSSSQLQTFLKVQGLKSRFSSGKPRAVVLLMAGTTAGIICYCTCKAGMRTVGGCAHGVAALYLFVMHKEAILEGRPTEEALTKPVNNFSNVVDISTWAKARRREKKDLAKEHPIAASTVPKLISLEDDEGVTGGSEEKEKKKSSAKKAKGEKKKPTKEKVPPVAVEEKRKRTRMSDRKKGEGDEEVEADEASGDESASVGDSDVDFFEDQSSDDLSKVGGRGDSDEEAYSGVSQADSQ